MLTPFIEDIDRRRKRFVVYSPGSGTDIVDRLATRNVTIRHRRLPADGPEPFVAIYDGEEFAGNIVLDDLRELLAPPIVRPEDVDGLAEGYHALFDVLEESLFTALDRRQLLAASREIEDRTLRVGHGTLRAGFQRLSVFESQTDVYRRLATETGLQIHVYGEPDWTPPAIENVTYHEDSDGELAPFWCLAFDGGHDETQACALVAREREPGEAGEWGPAWTGGRGAPTASDDRGDDDGTEDSYAGFWTYDPELVAEILATLEAAE